jgi:hypothetical protein
MGILLLKKENSIFGNRYFQKRKVVPERAHYVEFNGILCFGVAFVDIEKKCCECVKKPGDP